MGFGCERQAQPPLPRLPRASDYRGSCRDRKTRLLLAILGHVANDAPMTCHASRVLDLEGEGVDAEGQVVGGEVLLDELLEEGETVSAGLVKISCCGSLAHGSHALPACQDNSEGYHTRD